MEVAGGITIKHQRLDVSGGLERGIGEEALLLAFLAKVSTKFDLIDRATEDSVARRRQVQLAGERGLYGQQNELKGAPSGAPWLLLFL
jgi:hypothetical protein